MISILEEELVSKKKWITSRDMLDMLVIAESTPGVIAVNTATSVGFRLRGVAGALLATLGVVLPSFAIITALSFFIRAFAQNSWYRAAFTGIQACVTVLVLNAFIRMLSQMERSVFAFVLMFSAFAVALFTDFNVIYVILIGGVLGVVYAVAADALRKRRNKDLPLSSSELDVGQQPDIGQQPVDSEAQQLQDSEEEDK